MFVMSTLNMEVNAKFVYDMKQNVLGLFCASSVYNTVHRNICFVNIQKEHYKNINFAENVVSL